MIYKNGKKVIPYKDDYQPIKLYRDGHLISSAKKTTDSGKLLSVFSDYKTPLVTKLNGNTDKVLDKSYKAGEIAGYSEVVESTNLYDVTQWKNYQGEGIVGTANGTGTYSSDGTITLTASSSDCRMDGISYSIGETYVSRHGPLVKIKSKTIVVKLFNKTNVNQLMVSFLDKDKISVARQEGSSVPYTQISDGVPFTAPDNAQYIILRVGNNQSIEGMTISFKVMIVDGSVAPTSYQPYFAPFIKNGGVRNMVSGLTFNNPFPSMYEVNGNKVKVISTITEMNSWFYGTYGDWYNKLNTFKDIFLKAGVTYKSFDGFYLFSVSTDKTTAKSFVGVFTPDRDYYVQAIRMTSNYSSIAVGTILNICIVESSSELTTPIDNDSNYHLLTDDLDIPLSEPLREGDTLITDVGVRRNVLQGTMSVTSLRNINTDYGNAGVGIEIGFSQMPNALTDKQYFGIALTNFDNFRLQNGGYWNSVAQKRVNCAFPNHGSYFILDKSFFPNIDNYESTADKLSYILSVMGVSSLEIEAIYYTTTPTLTPLKLTPSALTYAKDGYKDLTLSNVREAGDYHLESVESVENKGKNFSSKTELYVDSGKTKPIFLNGTDYVRFGKGKNLLNIEWDKKTLNGVTYKEDSVVIKDQTDYAYASKNNAARMPISLKAGTYNYSFKANGTITSGRFIAIVIFYRADNTRYEINKVINSSQNNTRYNETITIDGDVVEFIFNIYTASSNNADFTLSEFMLIEGSTAPTEFEPYCEKAMLHREYGDMTLNGTESWSLQSINNYGIANFLYNSNHGGTDLWNEFVADVDIEKQRTGIAETSTEGIMFQENAIYFRIKKEKSMTVSEFKEYLSLHPIHLVYKLKTPTNESVDLDPPTTCPNVETTCSSRGVIEAEWWEAE